MMNKFSIGMFCAIAVAGCTSMNVSKIDAAKYPVKLICIEENTEVLVGDMLSFLEKSIQERNIRTTIYRGAVPAQCEYTLWYTAFRGWDFTPYMNRAELRLRQNNLTIASATYNHSGGLALNKWASTESKLAPVLEELMADFQAAPRP